jgi:hypothetical protein
MDSRDAMTEIPDKALLNAYVDGELDAAAAADILETAAANPAVAHELSALMRAKATVAGIVDAPSLSLATPPQRPLGQRVAIAAALVLSLATAMMLHVFMPAAERALAADWTARAHESWTGTRVPADTPTLAAGSVRAVSPAYIPDLSSAKLRIVHVGHQKLAGAGQTLIVGYAGTRGCRVTVAVSPRIAALTDEIRRFSAAGLTGFAWRAGNFGYYVIADGMSETRLTRIAGGIREASLRHLPLSSETQTALAVDRRRSPPCRA